MFLLLVSLSTTASASHHQVKVFILHAYSQEYPWTQKQHRGFVQSLLSEQGNRRFQFSVEYLDTKRRPYDAAYARHFAQYLQEKFSNYQPDLIYVSDDDAYQFANQYLKTLFPVAPIFFSGVNNYGVLKTLDRMRETGVFEKKEVSPNLALLRHAFGKPEQILIVGDGSHTYQAIEREIRAELAAQPDVQSKYIVDPTLPGLLDKLAAFQSGYVFLTTLGGLVDERGSMSNIYDSLHAIAQSGQFVILTMEDVYLTEGVLGGHVTSGLKQGQAAGRFALAYLGGTPLSQLHPQLDSPNEYMFDARELKRLRMELPPAIAKKASLFNQPRNFYERNRQVLVNVLYGLMVIVVIGAVIFAAVLVYANRRIRQHSAELAEAKESLVRAQHIANMGNWDWHIPENKLYWSSGMCALFGIHQDDYPVSYESFMARVYPEDRDVVDRAVQRALRDGEPYDIEHRIIRVSDGAVRVVRENAEVIRNIAGVAVRMIGTVQDMTESAHAAQALAASEESYRGLFDSVSDAICVLDGNGRLIDVNTGTLEMYQCTREMMVGKFAVEFAAPGMNDLTVLVTSIEATLAGKSQTFEFWGRRSTGEIFPKEVRFTAGTYFGHRVVLAVASDITARKKMESELRRLALHDTLTGLPNRTMLIDRLDHAISKRRGADRVAVLFIDLDGFKHINDTLGHAAGDRLLQDVAHRLRGAMREEDTVARLGGDEFVVLLEQFSDADHAATVAQKLLRVIQQEYQEMNRSFFVSASIGISLFPEDGKSATALLKNADAAMYMAKANGRNAFCFYTEEITQRAMERLQLEAKLRAAVGGEHFSLNYQPIFDLTAGRLIGAEALIRWRDPDLGWVSPAKFIPIAEETGIIDPIGEWVLHHACQRIEAWRKRHLIAPHMRFSINISGKQLARPLFARRLADILGDSGMPPQHLVVELTEGVLMGWQEGAASMLGELRRLGVGLAVDDFGTGYSSLSYLKRLPITKLKIDQSFMRDIPNDGNDAAIVRAIIALGKSLQLEVVAEGIETQAQADFLHQEGCLLGQGYLFSRPLNEVDFETLLIKQQVVLAHG